jgi:hypothetical protein
MDIRAVSTVHGRSTGSRHRVIVLLVLCLVMTASAVRAGSSAGGGEPVFDYGEYAAVLDTYVNTRGMVDYRALKRSPGHLNSFLRQVARLDRSTYRQWPRDSKVAFLVNAYNAITLKIIIDHYPIEAGWFGSMRYPENSIRQISGVFDGIEHTVMGRDMTLDEIEHETLREDFNEPRIHLALVCAAMSCPRLLNEPYIGPRLDEQFRNQAEDFVRWNDNVRISRAEDTVYISSIFDWFGQDFIKTYGTEQRFSGHSAKIRAVLNYLEEFVGERDRRYLRSASYDVEYIDYDWTLNEQK